MTTPGNTVAGPCGWVPIIPTGATGPCCPDTSDPATAALALDIATRLIWRLTGMRFGCCELTVRPCKPKTCDPLQLSRLIYWDTRAFPLGASGNLGVLSYFPTLIDGQVYNIACGCPTGCCKCVADCEIPLPGPICGISNVTVDGMVLDPSWYRVADGHTLIFNHILAAEAEYAAAIVTENALKTVEFEGLDTSGVVSAPFVPDLVTEAKFASYCPPCQDYNLPAGQPGTWTVTYSVGNPVPPELNLAAGLYAVELAKAIVGLPCGIPGNIQQVVRQGQTVLFMDPTKLVNAGLTGMKTVDDIIRAVNPYRMAEPSRVWFPGKTSTVRRDT